MVGIVTSVSFLTKSSCRNKTVVRCPPVALGVNFTFSSINCKSRPKRSFIFTQDGTIHMTCTETRNDLLAFVFTKQSPYCHDAFSELNIKTILYS